MLHQDKRGSCDGSYRQSRYFMCDNGHGAFLPASNILTVLQSSSAPPIPTSSTPTFQGPRNTRKKLLHPSSRTKTDRDFYLDDHVVVFDKDGRRVPGVAKWAVHGQERGVDCYIIGIETVRAWVGTDSITSCVHNSCSLLYTFSNCNGPVLKLLRELFPYKFYNSILCLGIM